MNQLSSALMATGIVDIFKAGFLIFIPTMAHVYLWGKMLMIINTDRGKNFVAFATILGVTWYYCYEFFTWTKVDVLMWNYMMYASMAVLWYVLLGFRLFSRMDSYLDQKFAEDHEEREVKRMERHAKREERKRVANRKITPRTKKSTAGN